MSFAIITPSFMAFMLTTFGMLAVIYRLIGSAYQANTLAHAMKYPFVLIPAIVIAFELMFPQYL
jgi:hypothetical protein